MEVDLNLFVTATALFAAWLSFRAGQFSRIENDILNLKFTLEVVGNWISSAYPRDYDRREWYSPQYYVHKIDISNLYNSSLNSNKFFFYKQKPLVPYLIQLVNTFNGIIDRHQQYVFSDLSLFQKGVDLYGRIPKSIAVDKIEYWVEGYEPDKNLVFYFSNVHSLCHSIHHVGIGEGKELGGGIPDLNKVFQALNSRLSLSNFRIFWHHSEWLGLLDIINGTFYLYVLAKIFW